MSKIRSLSKLACVVTLALAPLAVRAEDVTTLKDVVEQVVVKNPEVLSRWHEFKAATENIDVAKGGYRSKVDLSAGLIHGHQDSPELGLPGDYDGNDVKLMLDQMLFDGGFTRNQVKKFDYVQRVRYEELLDTSESVALDAIKAYADVLRYRKLS